MITILLADDHAMMRAGLRQLLERQPDLCVVAEAQDGEEAVTLALQEEPSVAVLDVGLPGLDGLEALERIKARAPQIRVLMLTGQHNDEYVRRALRGGASGYLLKEGKAADLIRAVRTVARGELAFVQPAVAAAVALCVARDAPEWPAHSRLTERERDVLRLVASGYSNAAIAARLGISAKTVDAHRTHLMDKLDLHTRAAVTAYALSHGFLIAS